MLSVRALRAALTALVALIVAVTLASCGGDSAEPAKPAAGSSSVGALADAFPENTLAYLEATVRPDGELADNAKTIIGKLTGKSPDEVPAYLEKQLDEDSKPGDLSWNDVKKFLGKRAAIGLLSLDGKITNASSGADDLSGAAGFVIEVTDAKAAEAALAKDAKKRDLDGQTYYLDNDTAAAVIGNRVVGASPESAFKTMADAQKASKHLSDSQALKDAAGQVEGDPLFFAFAEAKPLVDRVRELAAPDIQKQLDLALKSYGVDKDLGTYGMTASFAQRSVGFDFFSVGAKVEEQDGDAVELIKGVPADSWLAFGVNGFGKQLSKGLKQIKDLGVVDGQDIAAEIAKVESQLGLNLEQDLFSWMGDVALFARGTTADTVGGAVVVNSTNEAASAKAIKDIGRVAGQAGLTPKPANIGGAEGIAIAAGPVTFTMVQKGDKLVIASNEQSARDALAPSAKLGDSASFKAATEELGGVEPILFVALTAVADLAKSEGDLSAEDKRILETLDSVVVGSTVNGDSQHLKGALLVK